MAKIVNDTFTEASDTDLTSHTPDTGTGWTEEFNDATSAIARVFEANDIVRPTASQANVQMYYSAQPNPLIADYDVEATYRDGGTLNAADLGGIFGRFTDENNFYVAYWLDDTAGVVTLAKKVTGTTTTLGTGGSSHDFDVFTLKITTATKKVDENSVEIISSTDNALTSVGKAGLMWGGAAANIAQAMVADNFSTTVADQTVTPSGIGSGEGVGTLKANQNIQSITGIASLEAIGSHVISNIQTVSPSAIASAEAFGTLQVNQFIQSITAIASAENVPSPNVIAIVSPTAIASLEAFGGIGQVKQTVNTTGVASAEAVGTHAVTLLVATTGISSLEGIGTVQINLKVEPTGIISIEAIGSANVNQLISATGIATLEAIGTHVITTIQRVLPGGIASLEKFGCVIIQNYLSQADPSATSYSAVSDPASTSYSAVADPSATSYSAVSDPSATSYTDVGDPNGTDWEDVC